MDQTSIGQIAGHQLARSPWHLVADHQHGQPKPDLDRRPDGWWKPRMKDIGGRITAGPAAAVCHAGLPV
jgi:hypothetical protein